MDLPQTRPLRAVVLYSAGHAGSAIVLNIMDEAPDIEIVGILRAPPLKTKSLKEDMRRMGWRFSWLLLWQRVVQMVIFALAILLRPWLWRKALLPGWYLARQKQIPVKSCRNINHPNIENFIRAQQPDIIISAFFNRILKPNIIGIPRLGVLNIHPGWLPDYKGVMNYFWVLKNNDATAGVTLHWINEGIDTGDIISRRRFTIHPDTTQHQVLVKAATIGGRMAVSAARKLARGEPLPALDQTQMAHPHSYFGMPAEQDFDAYFAKRRFFRIRDVLAAAVRRIWRKRPST
jgi:folate-dependent phosphoribosylglycinamide formyltransferase PurN